MKMMQSIADAEEPFGSGRIELASTIQPFHICLLLLLLLHVLFLLLHILHLLLILILLLTTASPPVFLLKFKSFIPSPLSPSRNSNPTPSYFLASRALPSPLAPFWEPCTFAPVSMRSYIAIPKWQKHCWMCGVLAGDSIKAAAVELSQRQLILGGWAQHRSSVWHSRGAIQGPGWSRRTAARDVLTGQMGGVLCCIVTRRIMGRRVSLQGG